MNLKSKITIVMCLFTLSLRAQSIEQFYLYSFDHALFNPAAAGAENKHVFGLNGQMVYNTEDNKSTYQTGILSYNGHLSPINSGIGAYALTNKIGDEVVSKVGVSYNYKIKFAPKTSLRIGLRPTFSRLSMETLNDEKEAKTSADLDLGLWLDVFGFYAGASFANVLEHQYKFKQLIGSTEIGDTYSDRVATIMVGRKIKVPGVQFDPSIAFVKFDGDSKYLNLSNNFTFGNIFVIGGTYIKYLGSDYYNVSVNGGFNIANRVQIIGLIYTRNMDNWFDIHKKYAQTRCSGRSFCGRMFES
jgi:hypothetical protein